MAKLEPRVTEYEKATHEGRQIVDRREMREGYCGSCTLSVHAAQMRDPTSWVHSSKYLWEQAVNWNSMNKRPELDLNNPPGQIVNRPEGTSTGGVRYLRDVIRKYQEQERQDAEKDRGATQASTDAEKRLERLRTALVRDLTTYSDRQHPYNDARAASASKYLRIITEST